MERRDFIKSTAALLAAPALPAKALLAATPTVTAALPPNLYTWSAMIARTKGYCTPDMLAGALGIDTAKASGLVERLVANNVLGPANALGFAKIKPRITLEFPDVEDEEPTLQETEPEQTELH